jgi:glycosyltransferase involved in cell wall biosynthesis
MRILTFGWDYPPIRNGGLGVACQGLTEELIASGVEVLFVLPREQQTPGNTRFLFANVIPAKIIPVTGSQLFPYQQGNSFFEMFLPGGKRVRFSRSILEEAKRYAEAAFEIAQQEDFDIIHAHDWTSYLAGLAAKEASGRPLVLHVHATSYDQAGGDNVDPEIHAIEHRAFHDADAVVAISHYTKNIVVNRYGVDAAKVEVVHNGIKPLIPPTLPPVLADLKAQGKKIVFYNGRITIQKGVDYFVRAARKVVDHDPNVVFVISGWGDMEQEIMRLVGALGLSEHVIFAGALWDEERDRMYQSADLLVMPSVSEPFGLVPLEAIQNGTPALISKQSGVAEVLTHALKVDFWDVDEMANKIVAALRYEAMNRQLVAEGKRELERLTWRHAAEKVKTLYEKLLAWLKKPR